MFDNLQLIEQGIRSIVVPGGDCVFEVRMVKTQKGSISGYFTDPRKAAESISAWDGKVPAIYVTANPVNPILLARAQNRLQFYADFATKDCDIESRRRLLIDFDPARPKGISSSEAEHQAAIAKARECYGYLKTLGCKP